MCSFTQAWVPAGGDEDYSDDSEVVRRYEYTLPQMPTCMHTHIHAHTQISTRAHIQTGHQGKVASVWFQGIHDG